MGLVGHAPTDLRPSPANHTIPQKVSNVSIHDKGPEPESPGVGGAKVRSGRRGEVPTGLWTI